MDFNEFKSKCLNFNFVKNNIVYMIFFLYYFYVTCQIIMFISGGYVAESFTITLFAYSMSILIAISPLGDFILRFSSNVRILRTKREKEYLIPIFEDVYAEAKKKYPNLAKGIRICIMDVIYINAFALGRKTVAVTRGAVDSLSEEELKGMIAHELGHIANGDTMAVLLTTIGNGIFSIFIIALKKIINILDTLFYGMGWLGVIISIIKFIFYIILFYFMYIVQILLAINSRKNEYRADKFAYEVGYGDDLVEALYLLHGMCMSDKSRLATKLKATHPHMAIRIEKLEKMIDTVEIIETVETNEIKKE